jgi:hypothetical protein
LAVPVAVDGVVEVPVAAAGSAEGVADVEGIDGVAAVGEAPVAVVDVSAALATPIADRPIAEAISAYAMLLFSLRIMFGSSCKSNGECRRISTIDARSLPVLSS